MNSIQLIILSIGIALGSLIVFITDGFVLKNENWIKKSRLILIMFLFLSFMCGTGLWLGIRIGLMSGASNYYAAVAILLIMGIKVIFDSIRTRPEEKAYDLLDMRTVLMHSLAEGITPFIIATAIGLTLEIWLLPWLLMSTILLLAIIGGVMAGTYSGSSILKLRTGPIGGLILLAAAIKLLIDIIGY